MWHENKKWCKVWSGTDLLFQNWNEEFDEFWHKYSKVPKICPLMGSFWTKYKMFALKRYRGVIFHDTEEWCKTWRKTDLWFGKWHEEFGKCLPEHSKISKLELWWVSFIQNRKFMSLKFTEALCIITMKNDAKFEEKLTCFEIDTRIWRIFTRALKCLKKLQFNGLLLTKVYNAWAKKVQKNYVWRHRRLMQNLKENRFAVSKMTWEIWQTFTGFCCFFSYSGGVLVST